MKLDNENIEEHLLLLADHELSEQEEEEVKLFVSQHEAWKPVMDAYLATRLDETDSFVFPDKESLLKPEKETMILPMQKRPLQSLKIAAAVVLIMGLGIAMVMMFSGRESGERTEFAARTPDANIPGTKQPIVAQPDTAQIAKVTQQTDPMQTSRPKQSPVAVSVKQEPTVAAVGPVRSSMTVPAALASSELNKVSLSVGVPAENFVMQAKEPETELAKTERTLPEWLPVNAENLQGVNALIAHIQELKEDIQAKAQSLKNTAFVIRIGDRQIPIGK